LALVGNRGNNASESDVLPVPLPSNAAAIRGLRRATLGNYLCLMFSAAWRKTANYRFGASQCLTAYYKGTVRESFYPRYGNQMWLLFPKTIALSGN